MRFLCQNISFLNLTIDFVGFVVRPAVVYAIASQGAGDANVGVCTLEFLAIGRVFDLRPDCLEAFSSDSFVSNEEPKNRMHRNILRIVEKIDILLPVLFFRNLLATGDVAKKTTYDILMRLVSDVICEFLSRLSPQSSRGVLSRSFQGQTLKVAAGHPRSENINYSFSAPNFSLLNNIIHHHISYIIYQFYHTQCSGQKSKSQK